MKKLIIASLALFAAQTVSAADANNFRNLGFSENARYYAFVDSVVQDGSGYPDAHGYVIDVRQNRLVKSERVLIENESGSEREAIRQVIAKLNLASYGINQRHLGRTLYVKLPTDLTPAEPRPRFSTVYGVHGGASVVTPQFQLRTTESDAPGQHDCYSMNFPRKLLRLTLTKYDGDSVVRQIELQRDTRLPESRECASGYEPRQVIEYKGAIAAVVRYITPGFEGPDYNHMVVTGTDALK